MGIFTVVSRFKNDVSCVKMRDVSAMVNHVSQKHIEKAVETMENQCGGIVCISKCMIQDAKTFLS